METVRLAPAISISAARAPSGRDRALIRPPTHWRHPPNPDETHLLGTSCWSITIRGSPACTHIRPNSSSRSPYSAGSKCKRRRRIAPHHGYLSGHTTTTRLVAPAVTVTGWLESQSVLPPS